MMIIALAPVLAAIWIAQETSPRSASPSKAIHEFFPEAEDVELLSAAGLATVRGNASGDIVRYVLRRVYDGHMEQTARIVQAEWPYKAGPPKVLSIELVKKGKAWQAVQRSEAALHPLRFSKLLSNVLAAASSLGDRSDRGANQVCSHADTSPIDLSVPDQRLRISRGAHCSDDAPAVVAGELLSSAVDVNVRLNWSPK